MHSNELKCSSLTNIPRKKKGKPKQLENLCIHIRYKVVAVLELELELEASLQLIELWTGNGPTIVVVPRAQLHLADATSIGLVTTKLAANEPSIVRD